jgi:hypothetical protein
VVAAEKMNEITSGTAGSVERTCEHVVKNHGIGVHVHGLVVLLVPQHFRRHVTKRAQPACHCIAIALKVEAPFSWRRWGQFAESEIRNLQRVASSKN